MRKFLVHITDGSKYELPPLTFEEFNVLDLWTTANDMAWKQWLYHNNFHEVESFNTDFLRECKFILEPGEPKIEFIDISIENNGSGFENDIYKNYTELMEQSVELQSRPTNSKWNVVSEEDAEYTNELIENYRLKHYK